MDDPKSLSIHTLSPAWNGHIQPCIKAIWQLALCQSNTKLEKRLQDFGVSVHQLIMWVKQTQLPGSFLVVICCSRSTALGGSVLYPSPYFMVFLGTTVKCPPWEEFQQTPLHHLLIIKVMCQHPVKHGTLLLAIWSSPLSTMTNPCPCFRS